MLAICTNRILRIMKQYTLIFEKLGVNAEYYLFPFQNHSIQIAAVLINLTFTNNEALTYSEYVINKLNTKKSYLTYFTFIFSSFLVFFQLERIHFSFPS